LGRFAFLGARGTRPENDDEEEDDWEGYPLEARNGMFLFGLTVAFLFTMIQGIWPLKNSEEYGKFSRGPGSETVNPCARPIRLIRAVAMKRLFLEAF
jgi:hypothetical protein